MLQLLFTTTNEGKFLEFAQTLHQYLPGLKIISIKDIWDILPPSCEEDGKTFEENAKHKAEYYHSLLRDTANTVIIAEDSGIEIESLHGEPGVHSRRWNDLPMTDEQVVAYCIEKMAGKKNRNAAYVSSYFLIMPDGRTFATTKRSNGKILSAPRKASIMRGLPFRSLFYVPSLKKMFHEVRELPLDQRKGYELGQEIAAYQIASFVSDESIRHMRREPVR